MRSVITLAALLVCAGNMIGSTVNEPGLFVAMEGQYVPVPAPGISPLGITSEIEHFYYQNYWQGEYGNVLTTIQAGPPNYETPAALPHQVNCLYGPSIDGWTCPAWTPTPATTPTIPTPTPAPTPIQTPICPPDTPAEVPEPATYATLGFGLFVIAARKFRARRSF